MPLPTNQPGCRRLAQTARWIALALLTFALGGCGQVKKWYYCGYGEQSAHNREYATAVSLLDSCLEMTSLEDQQRALYLQARARAHFGLENYPAALRDQEQSFVLVAPTTRRELINHAVYLRMSGKPLQSLEPLRQAEAIDAREGHASMMTQYNLGWSLYQLGRHEEAIAAFSKGILAQPDYAFAYFRRGLAYDGIGQVDRAEADFIEFVGFFEGEGLEFNQRFTDELRAATASYPELGILLEEDN